MRNRKLRLTEGIFLASLLGASVLLAAGYAAAGLWAGAVLAGLGGFLWVATWRRPWGWAPAAGLAGFCGLAAVGMLLNLPPALVGVGFCAALAAWDLDRFRRSLALARADAATQALERLHLKRLLPPLGLGALAVVVLPSIRFEMSLLAAIVLGLAMALAFRQALASLK